ncbi:hypothetical protein EAH83_20400 [Variovorax ginsengisoli]|uniref:Uncharacterized protein n=1 Tax=Variovorax guangxiensis TaxID=1775474 RepID=A0A502DDE7_9BURK|nr:hypothetical protein EAH83_20400 [Variovorax ginsengisoli]TPG23687.1 hypothetical protein EAH82_20065 [Variovorax guangxiensis]
MRPGPFKRNQCKDRTTSTTVRQLLETLRAEGFVDRSADDGAFQLAQALKRLADRFSVYDRVAVENLGGASGTLGAKKVQRAPADGYTLLLG